MPLQPRWRPPGYDRNSICTTASAPIGVGTRPAWPKGLGSTKAGQDGQPKVPGRLHGPANKGLGALPPPPQDSAGGSSHCQPGGRWAVIRRQAPVRPSKLDSRSRLDPLGLDMEAFTGLATRRILEPGRTQLKSLVGAWRLRPMVRVLARIRHRVQACRCHAPQPVQFLTTMPTPSWLASAQASRSPCLSTSRIGESARRRPDV